MATIQRRAGRDGKTSYRVQVRIKGFAPETASFERLADAKAWASKTESEIKAGRHFGQSKRHTFNELADEYLAHATDLQSFDQRKRHVEYWRKVFGSDLLDSVTPSRIGKERSKLLAEETNRFAAPATGNPEQDAKRPRRKRTGPAVNRYLAALSACLGYGVKTLQWLEKNPCESVAKSKENTGRVRFLSDDERVRLLDACRPHPDLYLAVVLALTTGARQAEIMGLRWGQIDFRQKSNHAARNQERRPPRHSAGGRSLHASAGSRQGSKPEGRPHLPAHGESQEGGIPRPSPALGICVGGRQHLGFPLA